MIELVILRGREQNRGFAEGRVDALYAHTPYLETALVDQDAVMLVNQSAGEVPKLAVRQIHSLAVSRRLAKDNPDAVRALVRAVIRGQRLLHADRAAAVRAILKEFPEMNERHVQTVVDIYEPAIPRTPRVSADGFQAALDLFPATRQRPDLAGIDLNQFVAPEFVDAALQSLEK